MTRVLAVGEEEARMDPACSGWWTLEKTGCEVRHTDGQQGAAPKRRMGASRDQFIPGHPREHDFTGSGALVTC